MDFEQQVRDFIRPRLGAKPGNQFLRAWRQASSQPCELIKRVIEPLLYDPQAQRYICVSEIPNLAGRNHRGAETVWESSQDDIPGSLQHFSYFTNVMQIGTPWYDATGFEHWTGPSTRILGDAPQVMTLEFDVPDIEFLKLQMGWCRSATGKAIDAPLGDVYRHLSGFADFVGITASWSGNKSLHLHFVFETDLAIAAYRLDPGPGIMRAGIARHWFDLEETVLRLLKVPEGIRADRMVRTPDSFRRLPNGFRTVGSDHLLGIPKGTRVPQLALWEMYRGRRADGANELFWRPEKFVEPLRAGRISTRGIGVPELISTGSLNEDERKYCEDRLKGTWRWLNGEWPKVYRLEYVRDEWTARFWNTKDDGNPSSIMKEAYSKPLLCGRDAHLMIVRPLPAPLGIMMQRWLDEYRREPDQEGEDEIAGDHDQVREDTYWTDAPLRERPLSQIELDFQEQATTLEVVGKLAEDAILQAVADEDSPLLWVKGPEGGGKTRALLRRHGDICRMAAPHRDQAASMYAFTSYDQAAEKCREFNLMNRKGLHRGVVIRSWEAEYRIICTRLNLVDWDLEGAVDAGYASVWDAVQQTQPEAMDALRQRHQEVWADIGRKRVVWFTSHALMERWNTWSRSRMFWHKRFWDQRPVGTTDADWHRTLKIDMRLTLAIYDEVSAASLLDRYPEAVVHWVDGLRKAEKAWRKDGASTLERLEAFRRHPDKPEGLGFHTAMTIAEGSRKAWEAVRLRDSGEYRDESSASNIESIYGKFASGVWYVRPRHWYAGLADRVVVTTTEVQPTLVASRMPAVTIRRAWGNRSRQTATWRLLELETPRLDRDTVLVEFDRRVTKNGVREVVEGFLRRHGDEYEIVSNCMGDMPRSSNHARAKGSNGYMGRNVIQTMLHMAPAQVEDQEVLNAWLGVACCVGLCHADDFNQACGRNLGFRRRGDPEHWLLISQSLWGKIDQVLIGHSRYDFRVEVDDRQIYHIRRRVAA